jgi:hypothetical protein
LVVWPFARKPNFRMWLSRKKSLPLHVVAEMDISIKSMSLINTIVQIDLCGNCETEANDVWILSPSGSLLSHKMCITHTVTYSIFRNATIKSTRNSKKEDASFSAMRGETSLLFVFSRVYTEANSSSQIHSHTPPYTKHA